MQRASTKDRTSRYQNFEAACHDANVVHMETFKLLLEVAKKLTVTFKSIAESPEMLEFTDQVIEVGLAFINIHHTTNELYQYLKGHKDKRLKQRLEPDIKVLGGKMKKIKRYLKEDLSKKILKELVWLKRLFKAEDYRESQHKIRQFVGHFNAKIVTINKTIGEYEIILKALETKIQETSNDDEMGHVGQMGLMAIGAGAGTLGSVVVVAMMSNPITAIVGGVGLAGMSLAGGIWAGLRSNTRDSQPDVFETFYTLVINYINRTENQERIEFSNKNK